MTAKYYLSHCHGFYSMTTATTSSTTDQHVAAGNEGAVFAGVEADVAIIVAAEEAVMAAMMASHVWVPDGDVGRHVVEAVSGITFSFVYT